MSCGIYKITNKINGKNYIGQSKNIEQRWIAHKSEARVEHNPQYNYSIHKAFRKYGIENFEFSILEEVENSANLNEREIYWISYFDSYNKGYNETIGGDGGPVKYGEENGNSKLNQEDVIQIRTMLLEGKMLSEVFPLFSNKISKRGFQHVWQGNTWKNIIPEAIQYVKSKEYLTRARSFAGQLAFSNKKKNI